MLPQTGVGGMGQAESRARDPDGAVHGAVAVAVADSAAPHLASVPADPPPGIARPQLGAILLRNGAIRADDLVRALELQTRRKAHLGDILRAHGLASDQAVMAALAEQFGTSVIDPAHSRPDPRLIDRLGPRRCLQIGCLPWSRAGACTLVACARPDQFHLHRDEIEAALGPVAMAVIPEPDLHAALLGSRRSALRLMADAPRRVPKQRQHGHARCFDRLMAELRQLQQLRVHIGQALDIPRYPVGQPAARERVQRGILQKARVAKHGAQRRAHFVGKGVQQALPALRFLRQMPLALLHRRMHLAERLQQCADFIL